ncbi:MAG: CvpA family protein, partial [Clostridiales bacterium]|nr:CvpA family protein [Clostridiales bacterium]
MYIDIAIIAIVVLGALIGLWRGFFKTVISFFGWFVSFIIAAAITKPIAGALLDVGKIRGFVVGTNGWSLYSWIYGKMPDLAGEGMGGFLGMVLKPVLKVAGTVAGDLTQNVSLLLANGVFNIIVCVALLIILRVLLLLFTMFANAMTRGKFTGALNRFLGLVFGAVRGGALVALVMVVFTFIMGLSFMNPVRNQIDNSVIAAPVYRQVSNLTDKFLSGNTSMLNKLRIISGLDREDAGEEQPAPEVGEYTSVDDDGTSTIVIALAADGTFTQTAAGDVRNGTYTIEGETLTLHFTDLNEDVACTIHIEQGWIQMGELILGKPDAQLPPQEDEQS